MPLILPFLAALIIAAVITPFLRRYLVKTQLGIAVPRERDVHVKPVPRLGGLAIIASVFLVIIFYLIWQPSDLQFVHDQGVPLIFGIDRNLFGVLAGAIILAVTGVIDDIKSMNPWVKLGFQALAAACVVAFGVQIHWLSNPFGGNNIILGSLTYLIVPVWLIMMINVMNWFDGLDGLTGGLSVIACTAMVFLSLEPIVNQPATALLAAIVAGAALGFLPYNWNPAKIFLGDTGSMFLGYMIGVFAIISGAKLATAALVLGIPILDAFWVIGRRLLTGQSPMKADKLHLHHRFLAVGFSPRITVLILYAISVCFGMIALATSTQGKVTAFVSLLVFSVGLAVGLVVLDKRRRV